MKLWERGFIEFLLENLSLADQGSSDKASPSFAAFQMPSAPNNQNIEVAYFVAACPATFIMMWTRIPAVIGVVFVLFSYSGVPVLGWTLIYQQDVRLDKAACLNRERKSCYMASCILSEEYISFHSILPC